MAQLVTLENNFHNTSIRMRLEVDTTYEGNAFFVELTESQAKTAKKKLCGSKDCVCGGIRGPQFFDGKRLVVGSH